MWCHRRTRPDHRVHLLARWMQARACDYASSAGSSALVLDRFAAKQLRDFRSHSPTLKESSLAGIGGWVGSLLTSSLEMYVRASLPRARRLSLSSDLQQRLRHCPHGVPQNLWGWTCAQESGTQPEAPGTDPARQVLQGMPKTSPGALCVF